MEIRSTDRPEVGRGDCELTTTRKSSGENVGRFRPIKKRNEARLHIRRSRDVRPDCRERR